MDELSVADQVTVLRRYLAGDMRMLELADALAGHMSINGDVGDLSIQINSPLKAKIPLTPDQLRPMFERYLAWQVDDDELARWATLLLMLDPYTNPLGLSEEESDLIMDPLWDILWDLSSPPLLNKSLRDRVTEALPELTRLQAQISARAV